MRLRVIGEDQATFDTWVAQQRKPVEVPQGGDAAAGFALFKGKGTCVGCPTMQGGEGAGAPGGPNLPHLMGRETFPGATFDITPENLNRWIHNPSAMKPMRPEKGTGM